MTTTKTKPFLMGGECEYSMADAAPNGRSRQPHCHHQLLGAIRQLHRWLPDVRTPTGVYIDNGSRYYLDSGNHNELSSPEVALPPSDCRLRSRGRADLAARESLGEGAAWDRHLHHQEQCQLQHARQRGLGSA